jgi:DNA-binding NtrC family response regulator
MSDGKFTEKLIAHHKVLLQFPRGIRAAQFARKLGIHRTAAYDILNSLELKDWARNEHGLWFPKEPDLEKPYYDLVEKALLKLAEEQNKTTMEEVASQVGIPPSNIEASIYRLVQKYGWKTSKIRLGEIEIDFNKPFDLGALKFG